jgi:predicted transcriptional regulator
MKVSELIRNLGLNVISGKGGIENEISGAYVSDLLSDVIGGASAGNVWITIQTHQNVVAVASLKDLSAVILVKGLIPSDDTIKKSNDENIPVLSTGESAFTVAGRLFDLLKKE